MKKIAIIFGTRPEAIKLAPLIHQLQSEECFEVHIWLTGQHLELIQPILELFGIIEDKNFKVMSSKNTLTIVASRILDRVGAELAQAEIDLVIVHGDTQTASMAAFASYLNGVKVAHVEAGLRSHNLSAPWPEEGNRRVIGALANYHFAPTTSAERNLLCERIPAENIYITGNTVIDALHLSLNLLKCDLAKTEKYLAKYKNILDGKRMVLVTAHRRENFGKGFEQICEALESLARLDNIAIIFPVHLNPNVRSIVYEKLGRSENILLTEPLQYSEFTYLMQQATIILTDSGGIQEEAPSLGVPVLVMRNTTERPEGVAAGTVSLVGTDPNKISIAVKQILEQDRAFFKEIAERNPYGDGTAALQIKQHLKNILQIQ